MPHFSVCAYVRFRQLSRQVKQMSIHKVNETSFFSCSCCQSFYYYLFCICFFTKKSQHLDLHFTLLLRADCWSNLVMTYLSFKQLCLADFFKTRLNFTIHRMFFILPHCVYNYIIMVNHLYKSIHD